MSENDIGQGGLRGIPDARELGDLYPEDSRQRPRGVPSNGAVTGALLNDDKEALYKALEEQRRQRQGR